MGQPDTAYTPYLQKHVSCRPSGACLQPGYVTPHHVKHQARSSLVMSNAQDPVLPFTVCICEVKWKGKATQRVFWFENSGVRHLKSLAFTQLLLFSRRPGVSSDAPPPAPQCQAARERDADAPEAGIALLGAGGSVHPVLFHALSTDGVGKPQRGAVKSHAADREVRVTARRLMLWRRRFVNKSAWLANC